MFGLTDAQLQIIVTGLLGAFLIWMQNRTAKKVDAAVVTIDDVKVAMNGLTEKRVESAKKEATAVATLEEQKRMETEQLKIDAAVNAATSTVMVGASNAPPALDAKVDKVNDTVDVIDDNVRDVKDEVLKDVGDTVRTAVKDAKG